MDTGHRPHRSRRPRPSIFLSPLDFLTCGQLIDYEWILIGLTTCLLVLTCLQARGSLLTRSIHLVSLSREYSIFVLRAISELTALSLAGAIAAMFERIKWTLVCRSGKNGARTTKLVELLALEESTQVLALLTLAAAPGVKSRATRLWSLARLLFVAVVPITGILIMSQVDIKLAFSVVESESSYFGYAMQPMNASMAGEFLGLSDLLMTSKFAGFLGDPTRSIDLDPPSERAETICSLNAVPPPDGLPQNCHHRYFVAGTSITVAPELVYAADHPLADIILMENHRGLLLDFDAGDSHMKFDMKKDCRTYTSRYFGFYAGALRLCVASSGPNEVQARLVACPGELAFEGGCLNTTSWHTNNDWTVRMQGYFQNASLAYSRSNGTIIWHSLDDAHPVDKKDLLPANVSASQILQAYDTLLFDTTRLNFKGNESDLPLFSGSTFAAFLWMAHPVFSSHNAANPSAMAGAYAILQSIMAIPLILCQDGFAQRLLPALIDGKDVTVNPRLATGIGQLASVLSPLPERSSPASYAYHRFEAVASTPTLVAYMVISGAALLACVAVQLLSGLIVRRAGRSRMPQLSQFPTIDLFAHCTVEDERRCVVYQGRSGAFDYVQRHAGEDGQGEEKSELAWLSSLRVRWARPASGMDDGLQLFSGFGTTTTMSTLGTPVTPVTPKSEDGLSDLGRGDRWFARGRPSEDRRLHVQLQ